jgi:ATP-dependent RNA helicase DeaD
VLEAAEGSDLLVSAQTGSGKTVAFGLAAASSLLGEAERFERAAAPLALVIAPTRELALQVSRELGWLYAEAGAVVATCVGGTDARREQRALAAGAHLVVGTPGRLRDHLERGNLDISQLKVVVLDEADEMLDLGFREDLEEILDSTPAERRTLLFSATIAKEIANLARRYQRDAVRIDTTRRNEATATSSTAPSAWRRTRSRRPSSTSFATSRRRRPGVLQHARSRTAPLRRPAGARLRRRRPFRGAVAEGALDALQALRDGHARACVATDVAARGLDLPDLGLVIHAELPVNKAGLLHRSGRTGRAGRKGVSVLVVPFSRRRKAEQLLASANIEAEWSGPPSAEDIRAKDEARLLADPMLAEAPVDEDLTLARRLLEERSPEAVAAALVRLYRSRLPEPEEVFNAPPQRSAPHERAPPRPRREYGSAPAEGEGGGASGDGDSAWFRLTIGRANNADPKWLIPLICRLAT